MKIKMVLLTVALVAAGCTPVAATPTADLDQLVQEGLQTAQAQITQQAPTEPAAPPAFTETAAPPAPTVAVVDAVETNSEFAFNSFGVNLRFFYPSTLKEGLAAETVAANSLGAPWEMDMPEHAVVYFSAYSDPASRDSNSHGIRVYRVADLNAYDPTLIPAIQAFLSGATEEHRDFPSHPFPGRSVDAQVKTVPFQNGMGYRFLVTGSFMAAAPRGTGLIYLYVGLTSDGQYLVSMRSSVDAPMIADLANGVPFNTQEEATNVVNALNDRVNAAAPADFNPNLDTLDALVQSILVVIP